MSFMSLLRRAGVHDSARWEAYYEGRTSLNSLGVTLPPNVRVLERAAPFPKLAVDVLAEVLVPEGYSIGEDWDTPELLRSWWEANDLDTGTHLAVTEALVQGRSYFIVGNGRDDVPRITAHRCVGMVADFDHMGDLCEAVRRYRIGDEKWAAHYVPGETRYVKYTGGEWKTQETRKHKADRPAVVAMVNKSRLGDTLGRSEIEELTGATDAASRTLTNLQVAQEMLAMPVRYLFGDGLESLKDQNGNPVDKIQLYFGRMLTGPSGASAGQLTGATLQEFINTYKLYAQEVSATTGIPPSMLGVSTDNPSSADAMRVAKERLISKAESKQAMFGDALEDLARLALEFQGVSVENMGSLQMHWRDPAVPSASAKAANLLQAHAQGVVSAETARDGLGLSPAQKQREKSVQASGDVLGSQFGGGFREPVEDRFAGSRGGWFR